MPPTDWPIPISTVDDAATIGMCLWRQRRQLFATVAVKATFTLVPGGAMTLRAPLPIECNERQVACSEGIEPGDLAPCLVQPEIWVRGHAWYPAAEGAPSVRVRLIVARDGTPLVRKAVEIPIQGNTPFLHALAPLSRKWPVRTRLLAAFDWTTLEHSPIDLPDVFDWTYYQAAPPDQRLGSLRGDEWIRLEGMHSTIHKFDTQLPSATCAVTMFGVDDRLREGSPLPVGLDAVQLDVDRGTCCLVFRGHTQLPPSVAFENLQFVAGLGLPERPIPKLEPRRAVSRKSSTPPTQHPPKPTPSVGETFALDESMLQALVNGEVLPFQDGSPAILSTNDESQKQPTPQPAPSAGQTFAFDESMLRALVERDALPFPRPSPASPPRFPLDEPSTPAPAICAPNVAIEPPARLSPPTAAPAHDCGSTFMLSDELLAQLAANPATPFAGGAPLPERDEPVDALAGLPFQPARANDRASGKLGAIFLAAMEDAQRAGETNLEYAAQ